MRDSHAIDLLCFFPASGDGGGDGVEDGVRTIGVDIPGITGMEKDSGNHLVRTAFAIGSFVTIR